MKKPTTNIILSGEKLIVFPPNWKQDKDAHSCHLYLTQYWKSGHSNQIRKRNKRHPNWKGRSKTITICRRHDIIYILQIVRLLCPRNSPGKNTRVGSHSLLQGIFQTQGLNSGPLHCRQFLYHLSHQGSPYIIYIRVWNSIKCTTGTNK